MTEDYTLAHGTHESPADGRCAMEWVSHLAGEPHSDAPACVSPVLRAVCIALNDGLDHDCRQRLRPYLTRTIGTVDDGLDEVRGWIAVDWLVRAYAPAWLTLAGCSVAAATLRARPAIVDERALIRTWDALLAGRRAARDARTEAFAARGGRVRGRIAARSAARVGREAAWVGAGDAAWAGVRATSVGDRADPVRASVRAAAGDAAAIALVRVCRDEVCGEPSHGDALRTALAPTLSELDDSAVRLLGLMLPTEPLPVPASPPLRPAIATPA